MTLNSLISNLINTLQNANAYNQGVNYLIQIREEIRHGGTSSHVGAVETCMSAPGSRDTELTDDDEEKIDEAEALQANSVVLLHAEMPVAFTAADKSHKIGGGNHGAQERGRSFYGRRF